MGTGGRRPWGGPRGLTDVRSQKSVIFRRSQLHGEEETLRSRSRGRCAGASGTTRRTGRPGWTARGADGTGRAVMPCQRVRGLVLADPGPVGRRRRASGSARAPTGSACAVSTCGGRGPRPAHRLPGGSSHSRDHLTLSDCFDFHHLSLGHLSVVATGVFCLQVKSQIRRFGGHVWKDMELWGEQTWILRTPSKVGVFSHSRGRRQRES